MGKLIRIPSVVGKGLFLALAFSFGIHLLFFLVDWVLKPNQLIKEKNILSARISTAPHERLSLRAVVFEDRFTEVSSMTHTDRSDETEQQGMPLKRSHSPWGRRSDVSSEEIFLKSQNQSQERERAYRQAYIAHKQKLRAVLDEAILAQAASIKIEEGPCEIVFSTASKPSCVCPSPEETLAIQSLVNELPLLVPAEGFPSNFRLILNKR